MTMRPVVTSLSQATRLALSEDRHASRIASEIWSAILSGWPSVTDSDVNKNFSREATVLPPKISRDLTGPHLRIPFKDYRKNPAGNNGLTLQPAETQPNGIFCTV